MLVDNANTAAFKRIFSEINASLFNNIVPASNSGPVTQVEDYSLQVKNFAAEMLGESPGGGVTSGVGPLPSLPEPPVV
jgi:hypothetical protein